jgi:hypothetical protein
MRRTTSNLGRRNGAALLGAALVAALPFVFACNGAKESIPSNAVQVLVSDNNIQMPESLPSGPTTFEVINTGHSAHSFGITGPAGDKTLDKALQPGETTTLTFNLDTGTYRVYTPVGATQGEPMQVALNVRPAIGGNPG